VAKPIALPHELQGVAVPVRRLLWLRPRVLHHPGGQVVEIREEIATVRAQLDLALHTA